MGWYHSDQRNQLQNKKVLAISQIRAELLRSQNIATIDESLKTYKQNIAIPFEQINPDNDNEGFILLEDDTDNDNIDDINMEDIETVKCVDDWKVIVE